MRGIFEDEETQPEKKRRDTELTLGSGTLLSLFFGLVLLCGLCFGLGYAVGRHSVPLPQDSLSRTAPTGPVSFPTSTSLTKPSAAPPAAAISPVQSAGAALATAASQDNSPLAAAQKPAQVVQHMAAQSQAPAAKTSASPAQPEVRPALDSQPASPGPQQSATASTVQPALASTPSFMVQIAAVASPEDAEVLMNALRQHGYAVSVRRNLTDNLIHVRIGPFATRAAANQWRLRLLNDGYNAVIQP
jgi:cell division septation protein DedD